MILSHFNAALRLYEKAKPICLLDVPGDRAFYRVEDVRGGTGRAAPIPRNGRHSRCEQSYLCRIYEIILSRTRSFIGSKRMCRISPSAEVLTTAPPAFTSP